MITLNDITADAVYKDGINTSVISLDVAKLAYDNNIIHCKNLINENIRTHQIPLRQDEDPYFAFMKAVPKLKIVEVALAQTFYIVNTLGQPVRTFTARVITKK